jgi:hypothetical protein
MIESSLQSEPVLMPAGNPAGRTAGRRMRSIASYTALTALLFLPPMFVFVPAALIHCGLRNGRRAAWIALVLAVPIAGMLMLQSPQGSSPTDVKMAYAYFMALVVAVALPALLVLPMVERRDSFGRVLVAALIASVGGLAFTEIAMQLFAHFSPYALHATQAGEMAKAMLTNNPNMPTTGSTAAFARTLAAVMLFCLPGLLVMDVVIVFVLSLVMVGRVVAWRQFVETRTLPDSAPYLFRNFSLPEWLAIAFIASGLSPLAHGMLQKVGANVLAVVVFLYLIQGLAIFRSLLAAIGASFAGVLFACGMLAILAITGLSQLLLTVAGLFDSFFDFRHFNRKDHSDESHSD